MISEGSLKTGVMMLKIQLCNTGINYILKYIRIEKKLFLDCNNILIVYIIVIISKKKIMQKIKMII